MIATLFALTIAMAALDGDGAQCNAAIEQHRALIETGSRRLIDARAPKLSRTELRRGCVVVTFRIERDGSVSDVQVVEASPKALGREAVSGVRNWRFSSGVAEPAAAHIEFDFQ